MRDVVLDEVKKELKWRERIIVKVFEKTFIKVQTITRVTIFNKLV